MLNNWLSKGKMSSSFFIGLLNSHAVNTPIEADFKLPMRCQVAPKIFENLTVGSYGLWRGCSRTILQVAQPSSVPYAGLGTLVCWLCAALELILGFTRTSCCISWQSGTFRPSLWVTQKLRLPWKNVPWENQVPDSLYNCCPCRF